MNIEHVRTFVEIANTGNFNRAAENLNVTQSTVSARIRALEDSLGQALFQRHHAGASMTAAGRQFLRYAMTMLLAWQQARQHVSLPAGFHSVLGLGAQVSLWERLIPRWVPWMRARLPDVALRLEADYSPSMLRQLADGLLDMGVMYNPRQTLGLVVEKLLEERLVLVSTTRQRAPRDWAADYIFIDWGDDFRAQHGEAYPWMETPALSFGLGVLGLQHMLDQGGAGYCPLRVVRPLIRQKKLHRVNKAPTFERPAYLVYSAEPLEPDILAVAIDGLKEIVRQETET